MHALWIFFSVLKIWVITISLIFFLQYRILSNNIHWDKRRFLYDQSTLSDAMIKTYFIDLIWTYFIVFQRKHIFKHKFWQIKVRGLHNILLINTQMDTLIHIINEYFAVLPSNRHVPYNDKFYILNTLFWLSYL